MATRRRGGYVSLGERRAKRAEVDDPQVVLDAAARFLEARQRSQTEVRRRLTQAGYRAELVESAIERLAELGMLDDEIFARAGVESRDRARPRGERALKSELYQKGVDRSIVDQVLAERGAPDLGGRSSVADEHGAGEVEASADEVAATRLLARRRSSLDRIADPRIRRQRAYMLLARNGFDPATCSRVATSFVADAADGPNEGQDEGTVDQGP